MKVSNRAGNYGSTICIGNGSLGGDNSQRMMACMVITTCRLAVLGCLDCIDSDGRKDG